MYDPDIIDHDAAMLVMSRYEWVLADNRHDGQLLEQWTQVTNLQDINSTHVGLIYIACLCTELIKSHNFVIGGMC